MCVWGGIGVESFRSWDIWFRVEMSSGHLHFNVFLIVAVVQLLRRVLLFVTPWTIARQAPSLSSITWSLLRFSYIFLKVKWLFLLQ